MTIESGQKRIILWAHARALSTAFFRAMSSPPSTKGFMEPYNLAYTFGPERISRQFMHKPPMEQYTFAAIKAKLEDTYENHEVVFVKEMAFSMTDKIEDASYFPRDFRHTFLIRHPSKAVPSYLRLCTRNKSTGFTQYQTIGMKQLYEIFQLATDELKQSPIVIDADDLLQDPEVMLKKYCEQTGIEFDDSMVNWSELSEHEIKEIFEPWNLAFYKTAIDQRSFRRDVSRNDSRGSDIELSAEAQADLNESLIYYDKLAAHKIKLNM